jgi:hypothetical protein
VVAVIFLVLSAPSPATVALAIKPSACAGSASGAARTA